MYMSDNSTVTSNSPPVTILPHEFCKTNNTCERGNNRCVSRHDVSEKGEYARTAEECEERHMEYSALHARCTNGNTVDKSNCININIYRDSNEVKNEELTKRERRKEAAVSSGGRREVLIETLCTTDSSKSSKTLLADDDGNINNNDKEDSESKMQYNNIVSRKLNKVEKSTNNVNEKIGNTNKELECTLSKYTHNTITTSESELEEEEEEELGNQELNGVTAHHKHNNNSNTNTNLNNWIINNNGKKEAQGCYSQMSHVILGEILTGDDAHSRNGSRSPELLCIPHIRPSQKEQELKKETKREHKLIDPLLSPDRLPYIVSSEWTYSAPHELRPTDVSDNINNSTNSFVKEHDYDNDNNNNNTYLSCDKHKHCTAESETVIQENMLDDNACDDANDGMHNILFDTYEVNDVENTLEEGMHIHMEEEVLLGKDEYSNSHKKDIELCKTDLLTHNEQNVQEDLPNKREHAFSSSLLLSSVDSTSTTSTTAIVDTNKRTYWNNELGINDKEHLCNSSDAQRVPTEHTSKRQRDKRKARTIFRKGMRVKGRWGCGWFPATVSEDERNGYVQLCWDQDSSYLHLRVKEVRLLHDEANIRSNDTAVEKQKNTWIEQLKEVEHDEAEASIVSLLDDDDDDDGDNDKSLQNTLGDNINNDNLPSHINEEESITKCNKATNSYGKSKDNQEQSNKGNIRRENCKAPLTASQLVSWMEEEDVIEGSTTRCSTNFTNANMTTSIKRVTPIERKKRCRSASQLRTHHKNTQRTTREETAITTNINTGKLNNSGNNKNMMSNETNAITNSNLRVSKQGNRSASQPSAKRKRAIDDSSTVNNVDECNHDNITTGVSHLDSLYSIIFDKHIDIEKVSCKDNIAQTSNSVPPENNYRTCESNKIEQSEHAISVKPLIEEEKQDQREEYLESQLQSRREENESSETEKLTNMLDDASTIWSAKEKTSTNVDNSVITTSAEHILPATLSNELFQKELEEEEEEEQEQKEMQKSQIQEVEQEEYNYQEDKELHEELEQTVEEEEEQEECVERPQVIESEDYYFCLPQPAHLNKLTSLQQGNSGMSKISVVQNVGLGRVMSVQLSKINEQEVQHETERPINSSSLSQWTVTMRTYETSQVTLRHNPVSNEIESQTRVFLSNKEITIPVSCLLFDIPVYVIDALMMKHVYILDEPSLELPPQKSSPSSLEKQTENWHESQQQKLENKCNVIDNIFSFSRRSNLMTCTDPTSPERFHASTIPVMQSTRAGESIYGANCNTNINHHNESSTIERNSTNLEYQEEYELLEDVKEYEEEMWERESKSNKDNNFEGSNKNNDGDDIEENEDSILMLDPRRTTALPHEDKCISENMIIRENSNNNNNKDANHNLTSLSFPFSSSIIPRAFHSRFTLPATFTPRHGSVIDEVHVCGLIIRDGSLVRFRHHYWSPSNNAEMSTSENAIDTACASNTTTSSFHDQLQWGKVQMMRRVNDSVALVVHTQAANSVFGGSKMCVITPDMIVDVITY